MDISNYQKLAFRTCKELPIEEHLSHMALGIASETFELMLSDSVNDIEHTKEEIGDVLWYVACLAEQLNIELVNQNIDDDRDSLTVLVESAEKLISMIKKANIYRKSFTYNEYKTAILKLYNSVIFFCDSEQLSHEDIMRENISKLEKRYPEKYSDKSAIQRLDKVD